eukprot:TRINITY_DN30807_c0_g1_i1.p1 TRINITY_DN30807_c0_g1~~TRINITY_DN30807_c0_g1_i1.p1  ORF type:complete len:680 (-),score=155.30 TRINITY_DN30807_c0_g1_i1:256-2295(-)
MGKRQPGSSASASSSKKSQTNVTAVAVGVGVIALVLALLFSSGGTDQSSLRSSSRAGSNLAPRPPVPAAVQNAFNRADQLYSQGNPQAAIEALEAVARQYPDVPEVHYVLAFHYKRVGDNAKSIDANRRAIELRPTYIEAFINMGVSQERMQLRADARKSYETALEIHPDFFEGHNSLAILDSDEGRVAEAKRHYDRALKIRFEPGSLIKKTLLLPPVYTSKQHLVDSWRAFGSDLEALSRRSMQINDAQNQVGAVPFYLAYTGFNNRPLMEKLYAMYSRASPALNYVAPHLKTFAGTGVLAPTDVPLDSQGRIRVGIVSRHLRWHSIGKLMRGLVAHVPRDKLSIVVFFPAQQADDTSRFFESKADKFVKLPSELDFARRKIAEEKLHVLLYPDIGMESFTYFLAYSRLAPVQCVTHGHPSTTGIATIDYFVSFEKYENEDAQQFYTEKLARIKGLSSRYIRPEIPKQMRPRAAFNLSADDHVYLAPQSLFKFHPDYDTILADILDADPAGKLAIIKERHKGWGAIFLERLAKLSPSAADRVFWLERVPNPVFMNYLAIADVILDPYPFGGDTSSREAFLMGTPVVTLPADQLAGRYTQAFYRTMGIEDCIATSPKHYVEIALRLANDRVARKSIANRILTNNHKLFDDQEVVKAWEGFFLQSWQKVAPAATTKRSRT